MGAALAQLSPELRGFLFGLIGTAVGVLVGVVGGYLAQRRLGRRQRRIDSLFSIIDVQASVRAAALDMLSATVDHCGYVAMGDGGKQRAASDRLDRCAAGYTERMSAYVRVLPTTLVLFGRNKEIEKHLSFDPHISPPGNLDVAARGDIECWKSRERDRMKREFEAGVGAAMNEVFAALLGDVARQEAAFVGRYKKLMARMWGSAQKAFGAGPQRSTDA